MDLRKFSQNRKEIKSERDYRSHIEFKIKFRPHKFQDIFWGKVHTKSKKKNPTNSRIKHSKKSGKMSKDKDEFSKLESESKSSQN